MDRSQIDLRAMLAVWPRRLRALARKHALSFFKSDAAPVEEIPDRRWLNANTSHLGEPLRDLVQGNILLGRNQSKNEVLMRVELRAAGITKAARLCLTGLSPRPVPSPRGRDTNGKPGGRLPCREAAIDRLDNANPKIGAVRPCHSPSPRNHNSGRESLFGRFGNPFQRLNFG
jgi:hypothetical protein